MSSTRSRLPRARGASSGRLGNLNPMFQRQTPDLEALELSPYLVKQARRSGKLSLASKNLTTVPERVWQIDSLDEVELGMIDLRLNNSVSERGEGSQKWWEHEPLSSLDLSQNSLKILSPKIKHLAALTTLYLQNNSLIQLPMEIGLLTKLTKLNLSHNRLDSLCEGFFKLTELRHLNISHNNLTSVDDAIGDLIMLEKLDMSHNALTVLPPGVGFLTRLTQLLTNQNSISDVPPDIGNLRVLRELDLSHNCVTMLPPLGELRKLEIFHANYNDLKEIPEMTGCLAIREIHLAGNSIEEIKPELIDDIANIRVLNLRDNKLEEIPEEVTNLRNLIRLELSNNGIKELPARLSLLPHLSSLQLEGNPLKGVRSDIIRAGTNRVLRALRGQLTDDQLSSPRPSSALPGHIPQPWPNKYSMRSSRTLSLGMRGLTTVPEEPFSEAKAAEVTCVDLCKNSLTSMPEGLFLLTEFLSELTISQNKLTSVPADIAKCVHLQFIDLSLNCLTDLPPEITSMERLREINIAQNRFEKIPECLYGLLGLEILMARDNKITAIDAAGLATIPRLAVLDLANNDIQTVPPELGLLKLHCLELTGNAFRIPRHAILEKGTASIMSYLRDRLPK